MISRLRECKQLELESGYLTSSEQLDLLAAKQQAMATCIQSVRVISYSNEIKYILPVFSANILFRCVSFKETLPAL